MSKTIGRSMLKRWRTSKLLRQSIEQQICQTQKYKYI